MTLAAVLIVGAGVAATVVDIRQRRVPNVLTMGLASIGLLLAMTGFGSVTLGGGSGTHDERRAAFACASHTDIVTAKTIAPTPTTAARNGARPIVIISNLPFPREASAVTRPACSAVRRSPRRVASATDQGVGAMRGAAFRARSTRVS